MDSPPDYCAWVYAFFVSSAVDHRNDGPTSSAIRTTLDLLLPSSSSQVCCSSLPKTTTRSPLVSDSATFSAREFQQVMSKNDTASSNSWVCWLNLRRLTASPNFVTAVPDCINRSSGSRVRLPTTVTVFPLTEPPLFSLDVSFFGCALVCGRGLVATLAIVLLK